MMDALKFTGMGARGGGRDILYTSETDTSQNIKETASN